MKKLIATLSILGVIVVVFNGCKDEVIDSQSFVKQKILGKWPLKYKVKTVYTDNIAAKPDTVPYDPIDTLVFTDDGMATKRNKTVISTVAYTVDAAGQNITFNATPAVTLQITFTRNSSIGFGTETSEVVSGKTIRTVIDDHYVKN